MCGNRSRSWWLWRRSSSCSWMRRVSDWGREEATGRRPIAHFICRLCRNCYIAWCHGSLFCAFITLTVSRVAGAEKISTVQEAADMIATQIAAKWARCWVCSASAQSEPHAPRPLLHSTCVAYITCRYIVHSTRGLGTQRCNGRTRGGQQFPA